MFHFEVGATTPHISCFKKCHFPSTQALVQERLRCELTNQPTRLHFNGLYQGIYTHWLNTPQNWCFCRCVLLFLVGGYFQVPAVAFMGCIAGFPFGLAILYVWKNNLWWNHRRKTWYLSVVKHVERIKKSATLVRKTFITPNPPLLNRYVYPLLANPKGKDFQTDNERNESCFLPSYNLSWARISLSFVWVFLLPGRWQAKI